MLIAKIFTRFFFNCRIRYFLVWNTDITVKSSTNVYINTVCQLTQQGSRQILKNIAKNCGIQTDLLVNMRNGWGGKRHRCKIVNQSVTRIPFANLKNKKVSECWKHCEKFWYPGRLTCEYEKWLKKKTEEKKN